MPTDNEKTDIQPQRPSGTAKKRNTALGWDRLPELSERQQRGERGERGERGLPGESGEHERREQVDRDAERR